MGSSRRIVNLNETMKDKSREEEDNTANESIEQQENIVENWYDAEDLDIIRDNLIHFENCETKKENGIILRTDQDSSEETEIR